MAFPYHHLKTFWGWRDQQLPDATVIWTSPSGQTYVTTPGSALLFPTLCAPTGVLAAPDPVGTQPRCADRTVKMPQRRRTRAQNRAHYIATQRRQNRNMRQTAQHVATGGPAPPARYDEPPPF